MRVSLRNSLLFVLVVAATTFAQGGERWRQWKTGFQRAWWLNRVWPEPWIAPDRAAVRAPFAVMVAKGWQEQNTLTSEHFEETEPELSETGRLKVADILINSPPQYRTVFVERNFGDGPSTAQRIQAVEQYVYREIPDLGPVAVEETLRKRPGTSGDATDNTMRQWQATQPTPRLPATSGASGGSPSGSGVGTN